jgi:hypothetical protein
MQVKYFFNVADLLFEMTHFSFNTPLTIQTVILNWDCLKTMLFLVNGPCDHKESVRKIDSLFPTTSLK